MSYPRTVPFPRALKSEDSTFSDIEKQSISFNILHQIGDGVEHLQATELPATIAPCAFCNGETSVQDKGGTTPARLQLTHEKMHVAFSCKACLNLTP